MTQQPESGLGTVFYPTTLKVLKSGYYLSKPSERAIRKVALTHRLTNDNRAIVSDDGFVGILHIDEESKAIELLNFIFAAGMTFGGGSEVMTKLGLANFEYLPHTNEIKITDCNGPSERMMFFFLRDEKDKRYTNWLSYDTWRVVRPQSMRRILNTSQQYYTDSKSQRPNLAVQRSNSTL